MNSHPLPREVLRHGNDAMWGDRTSQTVGIAGDGKPIGSRDETYVFPIDWHKHDINSHHGGVHTWRRSPDDKRFVIKGLYQHCLID